MCESENAINMEKSENRYILCVTESECDCVNVFIMEATFFDSNFFGNVTFVCMWDLQSTM